METPINISGFIEVGNELIPTDKIEPFDNLSGSTCRCFVVHRRSQRLLMKRLRPEFVANPRYVEIFRKEYETGRNLHNPNLVSYLSMGQDIDGPYIIMEYVDGVTLKEKMLNDAAYFADTRNVSRFFTELLSVLGYLHKHQVLHLDVKPDNVMLTRVSDSVKLIDLGFCYSDSYYNSMGCSREYAAPEQLSNEISRINVSTDLFAVGCILRDIASLNDELSRNKAIGAIITRSTNSDPSLRYSSAGDMSDAITQALTPRQVSRTFLWLLVNAFIAVCSIGFALYISKSNEHQNSALLAAAELNNGLVAYYPFNGSANDVSGNSNHGSLYGELVLTEGVQKVQNGAFRFLGANHPGHICIPHSESLKFSDQFTFASYLMPADCDSTASSVSPGFGRWHTIMAKDSDLTGFALQYRLSPDTLYLAFSYNINLHRRQVAAIPGKFSNKWIHIALSYSDNIFRMYVNGVCKSHYVLKSNFDAINTNNLYLGQFSDGRYPLNGILDEVRVYDRELSEPEMLQMAQDADTVGIPVVPELAVSEYYVQMQKGEKRTIRITSGSHEYILSNADTRSVMADVSEQEITLSAKAPGTTTITLTDKQTSQTVDIIVVTFPKGSDIKNYWRNDYLEVGSFYNRDGSEISLLKKIVDNDVRFNVDKSPFYRTSLALRDQTGTHVITEDIYTGKNYSRWIVPCMLVDLDAQKAWVFVNSKDSEIDYTMTGYAFLVDLRTWQVKTEKVFESDNYGWLPYFERSSIDSPVLFFFAYSGYRCVCSKRDTSGHWTNEKIYFVWPDDYYLIGSRHPFIIVQ
jgi:hypothetical protein